MAKSKEERRKERAVIQIQCAFRCHQARVAAQDMHRAKYMRTYNEYEQKYVYKNKSSLEIQLEKPKFYLNDNDLPLQLNYEAPPDYSCGEENTSTGFLLIVTSSDFPLGKWPGVDPALDVDHDHLSSAWTHGFIGKFRPENTHVLKNPTTLEFMDVFHSLRKVCMRKGFLVVYLASHVICITKGEKNNTRENSYLVFRNSVWDTPAETAESCVSLTTFAQLLNKLRCTQKTVIVNFAHVPPPRPSLFVSSKIVYPPHNFLTRLATMAKCAVIASCSNGIRARDVVKHSPLSTTLRSFVLPDQDPSSGLLLPSKKARLEAAAKAEAQQKEADTIAAMQSGESGTATSKRRKKKSVVQPAAATPHKLDQAAATADRAAVQARLMADWGISPPADIVYTERPAKLGAQWKQTEETGNAIKIQLPNDAERKTHWYRVAYWRLKTTAAMPVNFSRRAIRRYKKYSMAAPSQTSLVSDGNTLFGRALYRGLNGGAHQEEHPVVTVADIFRFVHAHVKREVEAIKAAALAAIPESNTDESIPAGIHAMNQSPLLILPPGHHAEQYLSNPVCYRCGPPAAPDKPFVVRTGNHEVLLEWYNPPFAGVPPSHYRVYMRNKSRNFNTWQLVYYPGDIAKTQFLVRDLPMGVGCQFRVSACNPAGWGRTSDETIYVTPGEENEQISTDARWRRIQKGGILAVLDHLEAVSNDSDEQRRGLRMLLSFGQDNIGYKSQAMTLKAAAVAFSVIKTFDKDPELTAMAFNVLGWCMKGKGERKTRQFLLEQRLVQLAEQATAAYRTNSNVMNALSFVRATLAKYLAAPAEEVYVPLNPQPKTKAQHQWDSDEEQEEDELDGILGGDEETKQ